MKMKRKPPIKHKVQSHKREGKPVKSFMRGSGTPRKSPSKVVGAVQQKTYDREMSRGEVYSKYGESLMPFFDQELITEEIYRPDGYSIGGYVQSVTTGKKYKWGENWTTGFTLSATRMGKHLNKAGLLPDVKGGDPKWHPLVKRGAVKYRLLEWLKNQYGEYEL